MRCQQGTPSDAYFESVQATDQSQVQIRCLRPCLVGVVKLASRARPTFHPYDARGLALGTGVGAVLVVLEYDLEGAQERRQFVMTTRFPEREHDISAWAADYPEVALAGLASLVVGVVANHRSLRPSGNCRRPAGGADAGRSARATGRTLPPSRTSSGG